MKRTLFYNAIVHTQAYGLICDSIAINNGKIIAVGNRLEHDPDFRSYAKLDLKKKMVIPGFVDAHVHLFNYALSLGRVSLHGLTSIDACLRKIRQFANTIPKGEWIVGEGYDPNVFPNRIEPDRYQLDKVSGSRPAFIFAKDHHSVWVNSKTLEIAGIDSRTPDPDTGEIVRDSDRVPTGILREAIGYEKVFSLIPTPKKATLNRLYEQALSHAYTKGVTGVHSFDSPVALPFFLDRAERNKVGLRINHYPRVAMLPQLMKSNTRHGTGTEFFRFAGIKLFADGTLGSQTALCFKPFTGSKKNRGIATTSKSEMQEMVKRASRLGFPCAIHAIGDKAVSDVLDVFSKAPKLKSGVRHRIEHIQLICPQDVKRLRKFNVIASMQPSHCPSDIKMIRAYWKGREKDAYAMRAIHDAGVAMAFGSDLPIEPLDPLAGIAAAVRRALPKSRDVFQPKQALTVAEALHGFTAGAAYAVGEEHYSGYLLPGYRADITILDQDITSIAVSKIYDVRVMATILDGTLKHCHPSLRL